MVWNEAAAQDAIQQGDLKALGKKRKPKDKPLSDQPTRITGADTIAVMEDRLMQALERLGKVRQLCPVDDVVGVNLCLNEMREAVHHVAVVMLAAVKATARKKDNETDP